MSIADKLSQIAENEQKVYAAGKNEGKAARDKAWWDAFMTNVKNYPYANKYVFAGRGWTDENFSPTASLTPIVAEGMFYQNGVKNYKEILERNGVTFDFSKATAVTNLFFYSQIEDFPTIDLSSATGSLSYTFAYLQGENVSLPLVLPSSQYVNFPNTFYGSYGLVNLIILGGVIGQNFDVSACSKLSKESIFGIVNALATDVTGKTLTLSKAAVEAFDDEVTTIPFGLTAEQEGANVTGADNGDGTATFNGTIEQDSYFYYGEASAVFSAGAYAITYEGSGEFDVCVTLYDLDGNFIDGHSKWSCVGGVSAFSVGKDFVMKVRLYACGPATFDNVVVAYPKIRPDYEGLKATKKNWTISEL